MLSSLSKTEMIIFVTFNLSSAFSMVWSKMLSCGNGITLYQTDKKIVAFSKLKAFADDDSNVAQTALPFFDRVENIVGKGENAGYQHFPLFPQCLQKAAFTGPFKSLHISVKPYEWLVNVDPCNKNLFAYQWNFIVFLFLYDSVTSLIYQSLDVV